MKRARRLLLVLLAVAAAPAGAQSPFGSVHGDPGNVAVSGVSSGAAMAVQYALAHSHSVRAVGSVAGPGYRCAEGDLARAYFVCMQGAPKAEEMWAQLGKARPIDDLASPARVLRQAYVFQSEADATVKPASGHATAALLRKAGLAVTYDQGDAGDGSAAAGHGFLSPDGSDPCRGDGGSFVRACGGKDLAGDMFQAFYGTGARPARARPAAAARPFPQDPFVAQVRAASAVVPPNPRGHARRSHYDFAPTGWVYVPPACERADARCPVHVAFHGCKMAAADPAQPPALVREGGYAPWADAFGVIVLFPQLAHNGYQPRWPARQHDNDNSCWDWWGTLNDDYATADGPQMRVVEAMVRALTR